MKFSVVIPTYNYGRFLNMAVLSVVDQTYPAHEIIIVDDCSTDDTMEVAQRLMDLYDNVRYIRQPSNLGQSKNRNVGLEAATGDATALLDADDWWAPDYLEKVVAKFDEDPNVGLVYVCKVEYVEEDDNYISYPCKPLKGSLTEQLFITNFVGTPLVFKKEVSDAVRFDDNLNEFNNLGADWWFALEASTLTEFACVEEPLYIYRQHGTQMSTGIKKRLLADNGIQKRFLQEYGRCISYKTVEFAEYYAALKQGYYLRDSDKWESIKGYLRAIFLKPFDIDAYKGAIVALIK